MRVSKFHTLINLSEKFADRKKQSYEITKTFVSLEKAKPNPGNLRGLNLATIKFETFQMSKLQSLQKLRKIRHGLLEEAWADGCRVYMVDVLCIHYVTVNKFEYFKSCM
jgi:hypothetical protein